jgi:hypothetical protein
MKLSVGKYSIRGEISDSIDEIARFNSFNQCLGWPMDKNV